MSDWRSQRFETSSTPTNPPTHPRVRRTSFLAQRPAASSCVSALRLLSGPHRSLHFTAPSHSHTLTLPHSHTITLSHYHTLTLSHSHTPTRMSTIVVSRFFMVACESGPLRAVHLSRHKWPGGVSLSLRQPLHFASSNLQLMC